MVVKVNVGQVDGYEELNLCMPSGEVKSVF